MENFKKYLNDIFNNKKNIALGLVAIFFFGAGNGWFGDNITYERESSWSSDIPAIDRMLNGEEATGDNQLDIAYEWILENVEFSNEEGVNVSVERGNDSVKIVYTYDENLTAELNRYPFTEDDLIMLADGLAPMNEQIMEYLSMVGITDVNIDLELRDSDGHVYFVLRNCELVEYNVKESLTSDKGAVEQKKETKEETPKGTCIYCDGPLEADDKKSVCDTCKDDPMAQSGGKHMESTAPYGRCPSCNAALGSDKSYQGNYCDDCYAYIKQQEYEEKHKYGDCVDCGVYLSEGEANSYGGRCAECYARYYGNNNPNMGRCDRCGDSVDMDHTNDGWGYNHLCSNCTGELQMQESMEDASPYAG